MSLRSIHYVNWLLIAKLRNRKLWRDWVCMYVGCMFMNLPNQTSLREYVCMLRECMLWVYGFLMLWLRLRVLLYISFNGRWVMYVYSFTILYAIKRIYVIHESYVNRWLYCVLMFFHDFKTTIYNDCTRWVLAHFLGSRCSFTDGLSD